MTRKATGANLSQAVGEELSVNLIVADNITGQLKKIEGESIPSHQDKNTTFETISAPYKPNEKAFRFRDGALDHIEINQGTDFTAGGTILIEFYIHAFQAIIGQTLLSNGLGFNPTANGFRLVTASNTNEIAFQALNSDFAVSEDIGNIIGKWVNLAVIIGSSGNVKFNVEGVEYGLNPANANAVGVVNTARPLILGNLDNNGPYNRSMNGMIRRTAIFERELDITEIKKWNNRRLDNSSAVVNVDFNPDEKSIDRAVNLNPANFPIPTDGWGGGIMPASIRGMANASDYEYYNTGVDLSASVGEAFHGLCAWNEWLVQAPQDHDAVVCFNTITEEVVEIDVSSYVRAIPVVGSNFRDKFNGITADPNGIHLWMAPSWTTHLVQIDMTTMTIVGQYLINPDHDDAYNGVIVTDNYVWPVTHSKEDLPRLDKRTGVVTYFTLPELVAGDYNMNEATIANNRSFLGGANNGDGHIWLFPRRSKYLIKIKESTGEIVDRYEHPFANDTNPNSGYFHGASLANGKIYFTPWSAKTVCIFNIATEEWSTVSVALTTSGGNYNFGSVFDGRFVYFPPYLSREVVKVDTLNDQVYSLTATDAVNTHISNKTRASTPSEGFAGGSAVIDGHIWFSSSFESSYIKMPIRERFGKNVRAQEDLMAGGAVHTKDGFVYFGHKNFRMYSDGTTLKVQYWNGTIWADSTGGSFAKS